MPQHPTHPNGLHEPQAPHEENPPSKATAAPLDPATTPEPLEIDLSPVLASVRSTLDQALDRTKGQGEQLFASLSEMLEELRQERRQQQSERTSNERHLQSLLAATQRVESLVTSSSDRVTSILERETATVTAARRQLWDEAAKFRQEVRREIRWFLRAPLLALLLLAIVTGMLWMHREPGPDSRSRPPDTQPTERLERRR
jgi:hypothetical protein